MKRLSVIVPMYNSAKWLPKCLDSVLNQDVDKKDLEIVCINDGSPDNSEEIAKQYQSEHPDTIVVLTQENQGPSGARNNGMRHATGKYLYFVDPDDYVEPNVFGGLLQKMEGQQLDMLRFNYNIVDENYHPVKKRDFELQFDYSPCVMSGAEFLADRLDIACNIWRYFYRTDIIVKNQIWCFTGDYFDDTPWLPLVLRKAERIGICDTVVYNYQERSDSLVKATNPNAVKRKNDGYLLLMRLLQEEKHNIHSDTNIDSVLRDKIVMWYNMMISHASLSYLTNAAVLGTQPIRCSFNELRKLNVFPLSQYKTSAKNKRKIWMFNHFPVLMMRVMRLKNGSKH
ncbi:MAG: glycosyltransferase [Bacteroidales bacterium]|nr:glycosyltransferase [Bacteroidales bacterium]